ncbi:MAG TPA: type II secretion system protein [Candidatus Polarisedimenticolaceae bacterium]|nr:type II secretion system protein [Candidatus Polarisedimenticolaceae bacterium]
MSERARTRGVTLIELVCVTAIVLVLASVALPVANTALKRRKELELRQALREIRVALDTFQFDTLRYPGIRAKYLSAVNEEGYPEKLDVLVEGVDIGDAAGTKIKYLRRLPRDPITGLADWDTRSSRDGPESLFSDGINIFDVRSKSDKVGLNDVPYREW